jgi:hypothetical protein
MPVRCRQAGRRFTVPLLSDGPASGKPRHAGETPEGRRRVGQPQELAGDRPDQLAGIGVRRRGRVEHRGERDGLVAGPATRKTTAAAASNTGSAMVIRQEENSGPSWRRRGGAARSSAAVPGKSDAGVAVVPHSEQDEVEARRGSRGEREARRSSSS